MTFSSREGSTEQGEPISLYRFYGKPGASGNALGPYLFTNAEKVVIRGGLAFQPWPIEHGDISYSGQLDKTDLEVKLARGSSFDNIFVGYPPGQMINLIIYDGHYGDPDVLSNYPVVWSGKILGVNFGLSSELILTGEPVSISLQRPGLRRNYQLGCAHALFEAKCGASKVAATTTRVVQSVSGQLVTLATALTVVGTPSPYIGGTISWTDASGVFNICTVVGMDVTNKIVTVRGNIGTLLAGATLSLTYGCNRTMNDCAGRHNNIANYGGQPFIPSLSPLSSTSIFY